MRVHDGHMTTKRISCPNCDSHEIVMYLDETTERVVYLCQDCGHEE
jgi:predicted RNA-binding Zn-ribbon protein involved in translation (DUF1610 family)